MSNNLEGTRVPDVRFRLREHGEWVDIDSRELFSGRTVALFALPGAFTPTCSSAHLPRYEALAGELRRRGVDDILCLSVNDGFVMEAWGREQGAREVRLIADGNAEFTGGMGMLVDKADLGFGPRSRRYSMLVRDGVVEKVFVEPDVPGDPFEVSDADTMLAHLDPGAAAPSDVAVFTRPGCPHCARAKQALESAGLAYDEIVLGRDATVRALRAASGQATVPQVFMDGEHVGGADALTARLASRQAA